MTSDMYSEYLLEHARAPQNKMVLQTCICHVTVINEGCADTLELYINVNENKIANISFEGTLCALSTAAASLFTEFLKSKSLDEVRVLTPGSVYTLLGVTISESRTRCVLLCYEALQKSLSTCFPLQK